MSDSRDKLMDSLLRQHLGESPANMESRYARAFANLDTAERASDRGAARRSAIRWARAALIALCVGTLFILIPTETSASTVLARVTSNEERAATGESSRRYEVVVLLDRPDPRSADGINQIELHGNWDMRGGESRLELAVNDMPNLIRADSTGGAWEQRAGKPARRLDSRELWPRWIEERDGRVAVERMDALLHLVQRAYFVAFARAGTESPASLRGSLHIVASRRDRAPGPDEIDLWVDTDRNVVLEARLRWNKPPLPNRRPMRPDGQPPRPPLMDHRPPPGDDDYRAAPGALPPDPPRELRLRRIEPISFPADHFTMPAPTAATSAAAPSAGSTVR